MDRLISYAIALSVAFSLGLAWDRHAPIGWHGRLLLWRVGFDLTDSLAVQRDRAQVAAANAVRAGASCRSDLAGLKVAAAAQNAAVEALRQESDVRAAASAHAAAQARAVAESERVRARAILDARPSSSDLCEAADQLIDREASR